MRAMNHPFPEHSFLGTCIKLAQSTLKSTFFDTLFFDTLPSNAEGKEPKAQAELPSPKLAPGENSRLQRWTEALDDWFHRQRMKEREAYLGEAQDIFELEERIRRLERRPHF